MMRQFDETQAVAALLAGDIGVLPTDTVYGVVARLEHKAAVERLYQVKQRDQKPAPVIAASIDQLERIGVAPALLAQVAHLWPAAVSVVLPAPSSLDYAHFGKGLAIRIPADVRVRSLLEQTGPLVASSANITGQPTATTVQEAYQYFADTIDFYVDGGIISNRPPSTIVRPVGDSLEILRQGAVII